MRKFILKTVCVYFLLLAASCNSDSAADTSGKSTTAKTTFKLNGVLITADETTATHYTNAVAGGDYVDINAFKDGKQVLELHFPATTGTFPAEQSFSMTTSWLTYEANGGANFPNDYYNSTSGSIQLTTLDLTANKIRGTFNFIGNNTSADMAITEGVLVTDVVTHL